MALLFAKNNSLSAITALPASVSGGGLNLISTQTASSSATIDFTSGIDSTYKEYIFKFINIHGSAVDAIFSFQADTGTNTNYNQTITSSSFHTQHGENDSPASLSYNTGGDQAQGTGFQRLAEFHGTDNDNNSSGLLHLFDPSNTTFVKHFMSVTSLIGSETRHRELFIGGYFNTTSALTRIRFKMDTGNIDSGTIKMYGVT